MLVKILSEDYENATSSAKKCEVYFSYLKLRDTDVTDNTNSSDLDDVNMIAFLSVSKETVRSSTGV